MAGNNDPRGLADVGAQVFDFLDDQLVKLTALRTPEFAMVPDRRPLFASRPFFAIAEQGLTTFLFGCFVIAGARLVSVDNAMYHLC